MTTSYFSTLACFSLIVFLSGSYPACAKKMPTQFITPSEYVFEGIKTGRIGLMKLSAFAPERIRPALKLIRYGKLTEAIPLLRAELNRHPDDLTAYVGWMQADHQAWSAEAIRLKKVIASHSGDINAEFKLGVVESCQYQSEIRENSTYNQSIAAITEMNSHFSVAWKQNKDTIVALFVAGTPGHNGKDITDMLIERFGGNATLAWYRTSEREQWQDQPPPVELAKKSGLIPLSEIAFGFWADATIRPYITKTVNGRITMEPAPLTEAQQTKLDYMTKWKDSLQKALPANWE